MTSTEKALATLDRKAEAVAAALKDPDTNRFFLIQFLAESVTYHKSGKIEGLFSLDVASRQCRFCDSMQAAAKANPAIICRFCYARNEHETATRRHEITGNILQTIRIRPDEAAYIGAKAHKLRFNSDGELLNDTHADNVVTIAEANPSSTASIWTKDADTLEGAFNRAGGKPENIIAGISSPQINIPAKPRPWANFIFTVYTPEGLKRALARGEFPCNGRKCMDCKYRCYDKDANKDGPVYIAELLRKPQYMKKADFEALCALIDSITLKEE